MTEKLIPLRCDGRVHAEITPEGFIRIRCRERSCANAAHARHAGQVVYHIWDRAGRMVRTEVEARRQIAA